MGTRKTVGDAKPPAVIAGGGDQLIDDTVRKLWEIYGHDPYTVGWLMEDLTRIAIDVAHEHKVSLEPSSQWGSVVRILQQISHLFMTQLEKDLLTFATQAWEQGKQELTEPELVYAHGLLCAIYSTVIADRKGMQELESWATRSVLPEPTDVSALMITPDHRNAFFRRAAEAITPAKRMSAVLRTVAVATDGHLAELLKIVSRHSRRIAVPF